MNPVDEVLRRELTELLDRLATSVPEGNSMFSDPTFKARLDRADAELAAARAALLEGYGRWCRALEAVVNLWALDGGRSSSAERPNTLEQRLEEERG